MNTDYRIVPRLFGFEPQMKYTAGVTGKSFWTPLARTGYWRDPASFSYGVVSKREKMDFRAALMSIRRAKIINQHGICVSAINREKA